MELHDGQSQVTGSEQSRAEKEEPPPPPSSRVSERKSDSYIELEMELCVRRGRCVHVLKVVWGQGMTW